ncbi:hypothetical protein IFVP408_C290003 [Vibrio parahaemolyticus]
MRLAPSFLRLNVIIRLLCEHHLTSIASLLFPSDSWFGRSGNVDKMVCFNSVWIGYVQYARGCRSG